MGTVIGHAVPSLDSATSRFAALWGLALLYHQLGYGVAWDSAFDIALTLAASVLIVVPHLGVLAAVALAHLLAVGMHLPAVHNHWWFAAWISAAVLAAMLPAWQAHRAQHGGAQRAFMASFAAPARLSLLALYFVAGFHKLNADFLTPGISCATVLTTQLGNTIGLTALGQRLGLLPVALTLAAELGIPLLLLCARTRTAGLFAALGFHLAMAMAGYPRFSMAGLALLVLFLPAGTTLPGVERAARLPMLRVGVVIVLLAVAAITPFGGDLLMGTMLLALTVSVAVAAWHAKDARNGVPPGSRPSIAMVVPACVLLIGALPYLGLATDRTWGMYSNLRVEGGTSNHLVVPAAWQPFGFQRDLVAVRESGGRRLAYLASNDLVVPWAEFRALLAEASVRHGDSTGVSYIRAGRRIDVPSMGRDPVLAEPVTIWHRKLFRFRPVEVAGPRACSV